MPATPEKSRTTKRLSPTTLYVSTWLIGLGTLALGAGALYWYVAVERYELPWGALLLIPCVAVIAAVTFRNHFN
ncbi:MAG TPA: hypothetical protein VGL08_05070 [Paraburkholderia sp.]